MRELTRAMMRFSWALPLGAVARLADPEPRSDRRSSGDRAGGAPAGRLLGEQLGRSLDTLTWTGQRHMGLLLQSVFQAGDDLGSEWLDRCFATAGSPPPRWAADGSTLTAALTGSARDVWRILAPGSGGDTARREWLNKLEVYFLVRGVRRRLRLPPAGQSFELACFVERALALDPYSALWVLEGLGHDWAAARLAHGRDPSMVAASERLPSGALLMLHAGLGLALAEHVFAELRPCRPTPAEIERTIDRFDALCRANSRAGYADAALEALGLVARCFFPDLVTPVGRLLAARGDPLVGYFWHGVGRALYFVPVNCLPGYGSIAHALAMAGREADGSAARHNAVAGVVYAAVLVNLSRPAVVEQLLRRDGRAIPEPAFREGLVSAILIRRRTTPEDPDLEAFANHRPERAHARLWQRLVTAPLAALGEPPTDGAGEVYRTLTTGGEGGQASRKSAERSSGRRPGAP